MSTKKDEKSTESPISMLVEGDWHNTKALYRIVAATMIGFVIGALTSLIEGESFTAIALMVGAGFLIFSLKLIQHEKILSAGYTISVVVLGLLTFLSTTGRGIRDLANIAIPSALIIASLVLNKRQFWTLTSMAVASVGWIIFLAEPAGFQPKPISPSGWEDFLMVTAILVVTSYAARTFVEIMHSSLTRANIELEERRRLQIQLDQNQVLLKEIINNIPFDLWVSDGTGRYLMQNAASVEIAGDLIGKTVDSLDFVPPESLKVYKEKHKLVLSGQTIREEVQEIVRGEERSLLSTQTPIRDTTGQIMGFIGINIDLTGIRKAEKSLQESEEKYRHIVENAIDGIFQSTPDGRFISVNSAMARMYGYDTPEQMLTDVVNIPNQIYVDASQRKILHEQLLRHGQVQGFEMQDRRKDGTIFWSSMNVRVVYDNSGNIHHYEGTQTDITNRKLAEENLRQREVILNAVAVFAERLFKATDWRVEINDLLEKLGRSINASHAYLFEHHLGEDEKMVGSLRAEWAAPYLQSDLDNPMFQNLPVLEPGLERWYDLLFQGQPFIGDKLNASISELELLNARGMKAVLDMPILVDGKWWGVVGFDDAENDRNWTSAEVDVLRVASNVLGAAIQRQLVEEALQAELHQRKILVDELGAKNEELENFTYTVSHDLKAPLITISGFLGYLEEDAIKGDIGQLQKDIQRITDAASKMQRLLNELLELSRIGRLMNPPEDLPFGEIVQEALGNVKGRINKGRIKIETRSDWPVIHGDRLRLIEVVQNLVDNATKFMGNQPEPKIEIGVEKRGNEDVFFVRDNGIGVAPEYHEKIFGLFNKLDTSSEGTGIGLALVRRIIEVHGGRIWVESEAGEGAAFYFTLPVQSRK